MMASHRRGSRSSLNESFGEVESWPHNFGLLVCLQILCYLTIVAVILLFNPDPHSPECHGLNYGLPG